MGVVVVVLGALDAQWIGVAYSGRFPALLWLLCMAPIRGCPQTADETDTILVWLTAWRSRMRYLALGLGVLTLGVTVVPS